jgi:type I restriction enzyme S subunit
MHIGDIVLGRRGEMGRCAVVNAEGYLCGTGSMILRLGNEMKPYFLQSILSSPSYRKIIDNKAVGVTMKNINVAIVSGLMIPKLPISLQNEYLNLIEQIDKSKFAARQALKEITDAQKALMKKIFE